MHLITLGIARNSIGPRLWLRLINNQINKNLEFSFIISFVHCVVFIYCYRTYVPSFDHLYNMLLSKIIVVLIILNVQTIVSRASIVELASDEIDDFVKTLDTRVIYFETKGTL